VELFSEGILKELASVEGRYIEWEWDPRTQADDYIAMRESAGVPVQMCHASGRIQYLDVPIRALEELIAQQFVCEDQSKRASGFRLYRLTAEGRRRAIPANCGSA
jgi:hypothetical protein